MALLVCEGFDWTTASTDLLETVQYGVRIKGGNANSFLTIDQSRQRFTGYSLTQSNNHNSNYLSYIVPGGSGSTFTLGFGFLRREASGASVTDWAEFRVAAGAQCRLRWVGSTGKIEVWNNTTKLGESTSTFTALETWYYVEFTVTVNDTTGSYTLVVDDNVEDTGNNVNTSSQAGDEVEEIRWSMRFTNYDQQNFDDCYIRNDSTRHGARTRVQTLHPDGAGANTDFTPSAGSNFQNVDEITPDNEGTYNSSIVAGNKDTFTFGGLDASIDAVHGVQVDLVAIRNVSVPTQVTAVVRTSATDYEGVNVTLSNVYSRSSYVWEDNPNTASAWTPTQVNGIECGYKHVS